MISHLERDCLIEALKGCQGIIDNLQQALDKEMIDARRYPSRYPTGNFRC